MAIENEPLIAEDAGGDFERELPTAGLCSAVCAYVYDIGDEVNPFTGKTQPKVIIGWELDERLSEGKYAGERFLLSKTYTRSLNEKSNLYRDISGLLGKKAPNRMDLSELVGRQGTITVVHKEGKGDKMYANIAAIAPPMKGAAVIEVELEAIPEWVVNIRAKNMGLPSKPTNKAADAGDSDDIPF